MPHYLWVLSDPERVLDTLVPCSWVRWSASADDLGIRGLEKG